MKRLLSIVLSLCLLITTPVYAMESEGEESDATSTLVTRRIDLKSDSTVRLDILYGEVIDCKVDAVTVPKYSTNDNYYQFKAPYGTHYIHLTCSADTVFDVTITPLDIKPYLEYSDITVLNGFSAKNSVLNANAPVYYKSSDINVFITDAEGNITTRGIGTADLIAEVGPTVLKCKVTVKDNKYKGRKLKLSDCSTFAMVSKAYSLYYTPTGLCIKYTVGNNTSKVITSHTPKLTIYDKSNKALCTSVLPTVNKNIKAYSTKNFKLYVDYKDLPDDVINLTSCKPSISIRCTYKN